MMSVWKPVAAQLQAGHEGVAEQCCFTHESQYRKCRHGRTTQLRWTCARQAGSQDSGEW